MIEELLSEAYGLNEPSLSEVPLGMVNQNLAVQHEGRSYILKRYGMVGYDPDRIAWTWEVQRRVGGAGIPVADAIVNRSGELVTRTNDGFFVLMRRSLGHHYRRGEIPERAAMAMGQVLGHLHLALAPEPVTEGYSDLQSPDLAAERLQRCLAMAEAGETEVDRIAADVLRHKIGAIYRLGAVFEEVRALPLQWVHGDYQETNVLFNEDDQVAAVLDFDNLRVRPLGHDMMRALALSFRQFTPAGQAFFRGYVQAVRPPKEEVALYASLWAYIGATRAWPITARYEEPEHYQPRWDSFIAPTTGYWEVHRGDIRRDMLRIAGL